MADTMWQPDRTPLVLEPTKLGDLARKIFHREYAFDVDDEAVRMEYEDLMENCMARHSVNWADREKINQHSLKFLKTHQRMYSKLAKLKEKEADARAQIMQVCTPEFNHRTHTHITGV
jgi:hypothetical protein